MSRPWMLLSGALILCMVVAGCAKREFVAARVKLPASASDQSRLVAYAQSPAFTTEVQSRAATRGWARFEVRVRQHRNTSLLELGVLSVDPQVAAQAADLMVTVLTDFAAAHKLGAIELIDPAVAPMR